MGPINLIKMLSPLTAACVFTWALPPAAIFHLEDGTVLVRDSAEARGKEKMKPGSGETVPQSAAR